MAVRNDFAPGEVLAAADLNDTFASRVPFAFGTATPTTTTAGFLWYDTNFTPPVGKVWDGSAFVNFSQGAANFSNAASGTYTDGGFNYKYLTFTASGTLTVTRDGYIDVLVVGAGNSGQIFSGNNQTGGGAGGVRFGAFYVTTGSITVTVGAAGGNTSSFGTILSVGGGSAGLYSSSPEVNGRGGGGSSGGVIGNSTNFRGNGGGAGGTVYGSNQRDGISLSYTGSAVTYATGGNSNGSTSGAANTGNGGDAGVAGGSGVVIVRVRT
jgi:hypothetical protein